MDEDQIARGEKQLLFPVGYATMLFGKIYIDTVKEYIQLSNIDPKALTEIETNLSEYLLEIKQKYGDERRTNIDMNNLLRIYFNILLPKRAYRPLSSLLV